VGELPERSHDALFVGRGEELALLRSAWERAVEGGRCELVTIVGEAGVGKSRLVAELVAALEVQVVRGRCPPYGEGITYWPVVEVIKQLGEVSANSDVAAAIGSLLGASDAATSPEEIAWAFRKLLEESAPMVVVFDDIQWGEETFLDLVEHLALLSTGAPLLLLCMARPELSDLRPRWPVAVRLAPLPEIDVDALLPESLPARLRERIARAAGGNPLFVTEMIAMAAGADEDVVVPPTLKALLAARLDQLEDAERGVLERGSVEGELFHRGPVQALAPAGTQLTPQLTALVRRELIRPDRPVFPGEDGFRFCHLLIRDAAYQALPKATRAELHERFADWLEHHGSTLLERDELVGYHLEQAHRYETEVGSSGNQTGRLGERAATYLAAAARRASARGDYRATVALLERALALRVADTVERARDQVELGIALWETGRIRESEAVLAESIASATALDDRSIAAHAIVQAHLLRLPADPNLDVERVVADANEAIETFTEHGDSIGLGRAWLLIASVAGRQGLTADTSAALENSLVHADAAGDRAGSRKVGSHLSMQLMYGPTPAAEGIRRCEELLLSVADDRLLVAVISGQLSALLAMAARFDEARELGASSSAVFDELGLMNTPFRFAAADAKAFAGDRDGAERELTAIWLKMRDARGNSLDARAIRAASLLALLYADEGRWDEVERYLAYGRDAPRPAHLLATPVRLAADARLAAHRGELGEALKLARRAAEIAEAGGRPNISARVQLALAEVQRAAGHDSEADAAVAAALALYEQKGNLAASARLRSAAP
jgi:tetratricopeptide (TPR) repeat protein